MPSPPRSPTSPWTPGFTRLFLGQCLSWLGSSMTPVALSFGVLRATDNPADLGLVLAANTIPMVALLLLGGIAADRIPRRLLLTITHLLAGLTQVGTACWFLLDSTSVALLVVFAAANGAASAFTAPALRGIIVDLVPNAALGPANAARNASRNIFRVIGPGVAGALIAVMDAGWVLAADAVCLLLASAVLASVPRGDQPPSPPAGQGGARPALHAVITDLREGWQEFASHRWLWLVSCAFFCMNVLIGGIWLVLGPTMAEATIGSAGWGIVLGTRAAGQVLGGVIAYRWAPARPLIGVLLLPLPYAAVFFALGAGAGTAILAGLAAVAGLGSAIGDVLWETAVQQQVAPAAISRVFSLDMLLSFLSVPIGQLGAPVLALAVGAPAIALGGSVVCAVALALPLLSREVRSLPGTG